MACVERCPRGVAPAAVVEAVRSTVVRAQGMNGIKAEDIPPIVDEFIPQQLLVSAYRKYNKNQECLCVQNPLECDIFFYSRRSFCSEIPHTPSMG